MRMNILGLDTAQPACSAALLMEGGALFVRFEEMTKGHAEALAPMAEAVLEEAGITPADLDLIAVTIGPGTFTGTRVALSFARGLGAALRLPVLGLTSLEVLAEPAVAREGELIAASFDARRGEIYLQLFEPDLTPASAPALAKLDGLTLPGDLSGRPLCLVGTGSALLAEVLEDSHALRASGAPALPQAAAAARLAKAHVARAGLPALGAPPEPLYLREADAKLPKAGGALR